MMPLTKPQAGSPSVRDVQLMMPTSARSRASKPARRNPGADAEPGGLAELPRVDQAELLRLGRSVATSVAARNRPAVLRSP
jgi:hypothetical protein